MRSCISGGIPIPWSFTTSLTFPSCALTEIAMGLPRPNLMAFDRRFVTTWSRRNLSQCPTHRPSVVTDSEEPDRASSAPTLAAASRTTSLRSTCS